MSATDNNLDNHHCPKCNWSFIDRIPRTLDCKHSFYFCEDCLKRKENVKCGICRTVTIIKQILAPRSITVTRASTISSSLFSLSSVSLDDVHEDIDGPISQFATLPTQLLCSSRTQNKQASKRNDNHQLESFHKLFTSPLKHYKHYNKNHIHSTSEPIKHRNVNEKLQFEYDEIIDIQKEIVSLTNELKPDNQNQSDDLENEINFMKKQIVELLLDQEKLTKQNNEKNDEICKLKEDNMKLTHQNTKQNEEFDEIRNKYQDLKRNKLKPIKLKCQTLSADIKQYKVNLTENVFKPFERFVQNQMNELRNNCEQTLDAYNKEVALRRKHFNEIQELKGNIRVYCRVRPLLSHEIKEQHTTKVSAVDKFTVEVKRENHETKCKSFTFDRVFCPRSTQDDVFKDTKGLITSVLDGYNVCIFAYGQTGSGKTYTMEGINYRAVNQLFSEINERKSNYNYKMKLNMIEIYNEKVKDLLVTSNGRESEKDLKLKTLPTYLKIRGDDKSGGVYVANLSELSCESINDVFKALDIGYENRSCGITDMNQHSSRSHCILTINVEGIHFKSNNKYIAKLNLIDLAGSERVKASNATGNTLKEAQAINKSLSCLGNVLESIKAQKSYIPYRDSKLTFLLKDSIGNGAKALMFVNVSPSSRDINHTFTSLLFANRVSNVCLGKSIRNQSKPSGKSRR